MALTGAGLRAMRSVPTFGTIGAISEIVDNCIQAKTEDNLEINIIFIEREGAIDEILISDNGKGFGKDKAGKEIIDYCLAFGGGTRHNAKEGLGKFGVGLPYACCNQSEDYGVYSWQDKKKIKHIARNHEDFDDDEIVQDSKHKLITKLPDYFTQILPELKSYCTGTIIQWSKCDNLTYVNAKTIIKHLERLLGRIYRYYIDNGISINFISCNHPKNSKPLLFNDLCRPIKKFDPLFIATDTALDPPYNLKPTSTIFGQPISVPFTDSNDINHNFVITCSIADKEQPIQFKTDGSPGGNSKIGKHYDSVKGISLVRANREIRLHSFGFRFKNGFSDSRHRWYKIELKFEPISDSLLGLNANKTDAVHFRYIDDAQAIDVKKDYIKLRKVLSAKIQERLDKMYEELMKRVQENKSKNNPKAQKCPKCKQKTLLNGKCSNQNCDKVVDNCPKHNVPYDVNGSCTLCENSPPLNICTIHKTALNEEGKCDKCEESKPDPITPQEKEDLKSILKNYSEFEDHDLDLFIDWFISCNRKHIPIFITDKMNQSSLIQFTDIRGGQVYLILINRLHPYFQNNISPLLDFSDPEEYVEKKKALDSIILFFITWVDSEVNSTSDRTVIRRFRTNFNSNLEEILAQWNLVNSQ